MTFPEENSISGKSRQLLKISPDSSILSFANPIPEFTEIEEATESILRSNPEIVKEILRKLININVMHKSYLANVLLSADDEIYFVRGDRESAKTKIIEYVKKYPGCMTSDIIEQTRIDPILTMEILKELKKENSVMSKPIE